MSFLARQGALKGRLTPVVAFQPFSTSSQRWRNATTQKSPKNNYTKFLPEKGATTRYESKSGGSKPGSKLFVRSRADTVS